MLAHDVSCSSIPTQEINTLATNSKHKNLSFFVSQEKNSDNFLKFYIVTCISYFDSTSNPKTSWLNKQVAEQNIRQRLIF